MASEFEGRVIAFIEAVADAMGVPTPRVDVTSRDDGYRVDVAGEELDLLLRHKGAALDALQHITNAVFRSELPEKRHIVVDYQGYRRDKDAEVREMARMLGERVKATGVAQEIGPLNPYARRLVHLAIGEDAVLSSESVGDAFLKNVIISLRNG